MKTSVVIPCYNHYDLLHQVLFDLYKHCVNDIDEVVIVDDGSDEGFQDGIEGFWFKQRLPPVKVLTLPKNVGFLKASNQGMEYATGEILILLSNDVRIRDNFVRKVKDVLQEFHNDAVGGRLITFDTGWNTFDGWTFPYLEGWLIGCTRSKWDEIGGFDEQYVPNDFEDVDFSTAIKDLGGNLVELNTDVEHIGAQSLGYNPEREAITRRNKELFRKKWIG